MLNFDQILDMTKTRNKIVDVFKIDIEGPEKGVIETMDIDYFCKYVKQFMIETHPGFPPDLIYKLERCFYLFHRDSRLFLESIRGPTGWLTEWQKTGGFSLNLSLFKNEVELSKFLFTKGELYFVNLNFLKID